MRRRVVLVACEQKIVQDLLLRELSGEFDDLLIIRASSAEKVLELAKNHQFDIVLSCAQLVSDEFIDYLMGSNALKLLLRRSYGVELDSKLTDLGVKVLCFEDSWVPEMFEIIREQCDPKRFRAKVRQHIPGLMATLRWGGFQLNSEVINMNSSGLLVDTDYRPEYAGLINGVQTFIEFPSHFPHPKLRRLRARILRVHVLECRNGEYPSRVRVVLLFVGLTESQSLELNANLSLSLSEAVASEDLVNPLPEEPSPNSGQVPEGVTV